VGIALCDGAGSGGVPHSITFTIDGRLLHHHDRSSGGAGHGAEAGSTAANLSYSLEQHWLVCDLSQMSCGWRVHDASAPLSLPQFHGGHSRIKLRTALGVAITVTRNAMVDLGEAMELDCADYTRWTAAAAACAAVQRASLRGTANEGNADMPAMGTQEALLLLLGPKLQLEQRFHFMQVELPRLDLPNGSAHGLLGQRALLRPGAEHDESGDTAALAAVDMPALHEDKLAGVRSSQDQRLTANVGVGVAAHGKATDVAFGTQGEGAIEGVYTDYEVERLDDHIGTGRFKRFDLQCMDEVRAAD